VDKLFTLTVPSGAEFRLNQLTPGMAGSSVDRACMCVRAVCQ